MKRVLLYSILAVALAGLALGAQKLASAEREKAEIALAAAHLASGEIADARAILERVGRLGQADAARGLAWCDVLGGAKPTASRVLAVAEDAYPDVLLLRHMLSQRRAAEVVQIVDRAQPPGRRDLKVIERIAAMESGEGGLPGPVGSSALEQKLMAVQELQELGGERMVRDRNGALLGALDTDGELVATEQGRDLHLAGWIGQELGPTASAGVRLSLDAGLSQLATEALADQRGTIVVVEPTSGRVLTAVSDQTTLQREGATAFRDQRLEPASIAKLITASAALRAGLDLDQEIQKAPCHGFVEVDDGRLYCPVVPGRLSGLEHAMAVSCNTTFARLGHRLGRRDIEEEYARFGFARHSVSGAGAFLETARLRSPIDNRRRLAEVSIGLNHSELSPLHAAMMAAMFANGGRLLDPAWVSASDGLLGLSPAETPLAEPKGSIIAPGNLQLLQQAMVAVPRYGTAGGIAPDDFPVAMKTGTASEPSRGFHVNYIGIAPWPNPRYAFAVRITDRRTSRRVRRAAYAATARFLEALAAYDRDRLARVRARIHTSHSNPPTPIGTVATGS